MRVIRKNAVYVTCRRLLTRSTGDPNSGDITVRTIQRLSDHAWLVEDTGRSRLRMVRPSELLREVN